MLNQMNLRRIGIGLCATVFSATGFVTASTAEELRIGNTAPYSGPASIAGTMGRVAAALFEKTNAEGGIGGTQVRFISYDDGYNPAKTVEMSRKLVEQDDVALMFLQVGAAPNAATQRYYNGRKIPGIFMATASSRYGATPKELPWTLGWQPTSFHEGQIFGKFLLKEHEESKVAILFQNDDLGKDGIEGLKRVLGEEYDRLVVASASYELADPTVDSQIITLKGSGADVLIIFGTAKFGAQAIRRTAELGWKPQLFLNLPTSGINSVLKPAGLENAVGAYSVQFMIDPADPQWAERAEVGHYMDFMKTYYSEGDPFDFQNVVAYAQTQTLLSVLRSAEGDFSRENLLAKATAISGLAVPMVLPGIEIETSQTDYYPIEAGYIGKFDGEIWQVSGELLDVSK